MTELRAAHAALLREAIARSGLPAGRFANEVLLRNERTLFRWLAGTAPVPRAVLDYLAKLPEGHSSRTERTESTDNLLRE